MRNLRIYTFLLVSLLVLSSGCTSGGSEGKGDPVELNQVNGSGKREGPWEILSGDVLVARGSYVNGKPDGLWTRWYPSGQMKEEGHYIKGIKNGMSDENLPPPREYLYEILVGSTPIPL